MSAPWDPYLSDDDRAALARAGFGQRLEFGERAAVLVIDAQRYMVGAEGADAQWPSSCGDVGRRAVVMIARLVDAAHAAGIPCVFTRFELARDGSDVGVYSRKRRFLDSEHWCLEGTAGAMLVPEITVATDDTVIVKKKPSAFHGTHLEAWLTARGIDTLIVAGGSTSNCVRATVFDAASFNYRAIVAQEAVFDRVPVSHAISLFDMDRQYADVMPVSDIIERIGQRAVGAAGPNGR